MSYTRLNPSLRSHLWRSQTSRLWFSLVAGACVACGEAEAPRTTGSGSVTQSSAGAAAQGATTSVGGGSGANTAAQASAVPQANTAASVLLTSAGPRPGSTTLPQASTQTPSNSSRPDSSVPVVGVPMPSLSATPTAAPPASTGAGPSTSSGVPPASTSGGSDMNCPLPTTFKWTSGAAVAQPKKGWVALKDFTTVVHNNKHIIYMTTHDDSDWGAAMFTFDDWASAATAEQTKLSFGAVAPTLFYFTPKQQWILAYQWGKTKFSYRTSTDPTNATSWGAEQSLYNTALPTGGTGPIDQTVICNTTKCYLYYAGDNGHIYKSSMPIEKFPSEFAAAVDSGIQGTSQNLFEAVQIYAVKGSDKYLMIVEAQGNARYFRAWTASDLDGPWTLLTDSFATKANVTFSSSWTSDISHGDLVRSNPDETFTVDPCNLQLLFQGRDPNSTASYGLLPYRPGLLTLVK
jgi:hypothetical protein